MGIYDCNNCHESCTNKSFYRCVECDFNLHLKCIPIPSGVMITQKHYHPLTLIDSVKEDNPLIHYLMDSNDKVDYSMDYYCDVCETPGNPKHHVYYCMECIYIAYAECIISKDDTAVKVLKYLNPRPEKEQRSSTEDHCGQAELDRGNGNGSERMETLPLELEALEEKHANEAS
ncbi:hypothetical protein LWI29_028896 [Acer saccharum]|uniref:DC1 domain-containing protein n=1 Tax=Acer saccharum TaxID=4024 RepID=A0AA39SNJ7_ACESA|nr:hypothetical protein LWI29_028896 [Acer saccharum]